MLWLKENKELIGFISMVLSSIFVITSIILSYIMSFYYHNEFIDDILLAYYNHKSLVYLNTITFLLYSVLMLPSLIVLYLCIKQITKDKSQKLLIIPIISQIIGSMLLIGLSITQFYVIFKLSPDYVTAVEPLKSELMNKYNDIVFITEIIEIITFAFLLTLGTGFLGIIFQQTSEFKGTIAYIAIFIGVCGILKIGSIFPSNIGETFEFIGQFGSILYFLWLSFVMYNIFIDKREAEKLQDTQQEI